MGVREKGQTLNTSDCFELIPSRERNSAEYRVEIRLKVLNLGGDDVSNLENHHKNHNKIFIMKRLEGGESEN